MKTLTSEQQELLIEIVNGDRGIKNSVDHSLDLRALLAGGFVRLTSDTEGRWVPTYAGCQIAEWLISAKIGV